MSQTNSLTTVLSILAQIPIPLAYVVGLVFALVRWKVHPRTSLLVSAACFLGLCNAGFSFTARTILVQVLHPTSMPNYFMFISLIGSCVHVVVLALLFLAAFGRRDFSPASVR